MIRRPFPLAALLTASAAAVAGIGVVTFREFTSFSPYFGNVSPPIAAILICALGIATLYHLHRNWDFEVFASDRWRQGWLIAFGAAIPFMILVTVADIILRFPRDINVPPPAALLFYPAMGLVAQISLHIAPLVVLLTATKAIFKTWTNRRLVWVSIALAATLEAALQGIASWPDNQLLGAFVTLHIFLFGLVELYMFRRFDFTSMYVFRLSYYAYWHLMWGTVRLEWLF